MNLAILRMHMGGIPATLFLGGKLYLKAVNFVRVRCPSQTTDMLVLSVFDCCWEGYRNLIHSHQTVFVLKAKPLWYFIRFQWVKSAGVSLSYSWFLFRRSVLCIPVVVLLEGYFPVCLWDVSVDTQHVTRILRLHEISVFLEQYNWILHKVH